MTDRPTNTDANRIRGSLKEAIGKIIGDSDAIAEGAAEKNAVDRKSRKSA